MKDILLVALIMILPVWPSFVDSVNAREDLQKGSVSSVGNQDDLDIDRLREEWRVESAEASTPADDPTLAASLDNLASLYRTSGKYALAEPLLKRSLGIYEKKFGPDHPTTGRAVSNLADNYSAQGLYSQAEPLYLRALAIDEKTYGPDPLETAAGISNLALNYKNQGNLALSESFYKRSLSIYEHFLGPEHEYLTTILSSLSTIYRKTGRNDDALAVEKRADDISRKMRK